MSGLTAAQLHALGEVERTGEAWRKARDKAATTRAAAAGAIRTAVQAGVPNGVVATAAGVSPGRVSQIAPSPKRAQPPIHAQEKAPEAQRVAEPDTLSTVTATLSGVVSQRKRTPYGKRTLFLEGADLGAILRAAKHGDAGRVYLVGPPPFDTSTGATQHEAVRAWALDNPFLRAAENDGWAAGDHYMADPLLPVLRFKHADGQAVTVMRAASWWGETDADLATCEAAWHGLATLLEGVPAFTGGGLADTPATTGRALWLRTIPENKSYPVLSDELRELIASTSGQGRIELLPKPAGRGKPFDFTYMDGRFMYAALTWGMPVGPPQLWTRAGIEALDAVGFQAAMRGRGRWRITATVPHTWAHVGLLMAPDDGKAWRYPSKPGETFTTWADGSEVWLALTHGWAIDVHEGITWAEGKPLESWRNALVNVWDSCNASESPSAALAARAVRSILLYAIGAFATRAHPVTRSAPLDSDPEVPAGVEVRTVGDNLVWQEPGHLSAWSMETAHPEWSATIWARARTRLLTGKDANGGQVGALHLPPSRVVGFATDALYLAGGAPAWADDGKPGRFRAKGTKPGAFTWPARYLDLYNLRDAAER